MNNYEGRPSEQKYINSIDKSEKSQKEKQQAIYDYNRQIKTLEWNLRHMNEETNSAIKKMKAEYQHMIEEYKNEYGEEP